jgi:hypothetical protein
MRNPSIAAVAAELNRVRARHYVDTGDGEGRGTIRWTAPNRPPRTTIIDSDTTPARARAEVRQQLRMLGLLTTGTGRSNIRGWTSDAPPLVPSAPRSPLQHTLDALADRISRLSSHGGGDPTRFASERSEIAAELRRLARG